MTLNDMLAIWAATMPEAGLGIDPSYPVVARRSLHYNAPTRMMPERVLSKKLWRCCGTLGGPPASRQP